MTKPGWATAIGVIMIMFGGCGAFDKIGDINSDKITLMMDQAMDESMNEAYKNQDSIKTIKYEEIDSNGLEGLSILTDSIVVDSMNNVDMPATMKQAFNISDYRKTWLKRFGYMGLIIALLFVIGGIMLLSTKKFTIPIVLSAIALSLAFGIFQYFIYSADSGSGKWIGIGENIGIAFGVIVDIILLIVVSVSDKAYFKPAHQLTEDYYDDDQL